MSNHINHLTIFDCYRNPRKRSVREIVSICDFVESIRDEVDENPDKLAFWVLELADRCFEHGADYGEEE